MNPQLQVLYKGKHIPILTYIEILKSKITQIYVFSDFESDHNIIIPPTYENGITPIINAQQFQLEQNGWWPFFKEISTSLLMSKLNSGIRSEYKICPDIYPSPDKLFNSLLLTALTDIKVIVIAQDPYQTEGSAMGLAFSHPTERKNLQPSLVNIYKELKSCGYNFNEKSGDLTKWAKEGVLLINTTLTVRKNISNSHKKYWTEFTKQLFIYISNNCKHVVVIMWGNNAQQNSKLFDTKKHYHLKSVHPSPLSVNGENADFFGSRHFILANDKLKEWNIEQIDWNLL